MPPRIIVPPPALATDIPSLTIGSSFIDVDMAFLNDMDLENTVQQNSMLDWAYEHRRQAQMILPWLFLGPMLAAKDTAFLQREGITMVLAVRSQANSMMGAVNAAAHSGVQVATIEASNYFDLTGQLTATTRTINEHVARFRQQTLQQTGTPTLGKVLVFCESGNEKSAAVIAAYLMETLDNFDHIKAMQVCQAQRFCVNFEDSIKHMLHCHWDILLARRSVSTFEAQASTEHPGTKVPNASGPGELSAPISKNKRTIEAMHDKDVDMDEPDEWDASRFVGRDFAPFQNF